MIVTSANNVPASHVGDQTPLTKSRKFPAFGFWKYLYNASLRTRRADARYRVVFRNATISSLRSNLYRGNYLTDEL